MTSPSWQFEDAGRFTVGAMGEPGSRVFYFQVFATGTEVALKCEKQQAEALAEHLLKLLADLPDEPVGEVEPAEALPPDEMAFVVGSISLGVDRSARRLVVLFEELLVEEEEGVPLEREPGRLRVHLTIAQVHAYVAQVKVLLEGGRPRCRLCQQPMDPDGHACPRLN